MAHIDVKFSIWQRYEIEDSDLEKFMKLDEKEKYQSVFHDLIDKSVSDTDFLYDTLEYTTPYENFNEPTIKIYSDDRIEDGGSPVWRIEGSRKFGRSLYWDNTPIEIKRDKKINLITKL